MTQTTTIRLTEPTVGGDSGVWGGELNNNMIYIDEAVNQTVTVSVPDADVVLVADGSSSDQARYLRYSFTGALTVNRTITLPANVKVGWATNATSGGHNLTLTTGSGTTLTLTNNSWTLFYCDGTNVTAPAVAIGGTSTNDSAVAGTVGEYISGTLSSGSAIGLTTGVTRNVVQITLTAGDWDVSGNIALTITGTGTVGVVSAISTTSATLPTKPNAGGYAQYSFNSGSFSSAVVPTGTMRISVSTSTLVYLVVQTGFSSGTVSAYGFIGARRMR